VATSFTHLLRQAH